MSYWNKLINTSFGLKPDWQLFKSLLCIMNYKKISQQSQQITKRLLIVGDSIVKNIEPYIPGATTEWVSHHVKGCMVDFAPDIVLLHCGTNDLKKDLTPQKIAQNILKLAEEVSDGGKRDVLVSGIINKVMIIMLKYKR